MNDEARQVDDQHGSELCRDRRGRGRGLARGSLSTTAIIEEGAR